MKLSSYEDVGSAMDYLIAALKALKRVEARDGLGINVVDEKGMSLLPDAWMDGAGEVEQRAWESIRQSVHTVLVAERDRLILQLQSLGVEVDLANVSRIYVDK